MDRTLYAPIRKEGQDLYSATARLVCQPGVPKKRMDELVQKAWGGIPLWRVRACRLGEAGPFSAAAILAIQRAYTEFMARHAARAASAAATEATRQLASERATIERYLAHHQAEAAKLAARLASLTEITPD